MKGLPITLLLAFPLLFSLTSCITYERCADRYGVQSGDTIRVPVYIKVPVAVQVPRDSAKLNADFDSLLAGKTIKSDTSENLSIEVRYNNESNSIEVKASQKPFIIHDTILYADTIPCPPQIFLVKPPTFKEKVKNQYSLIAGWSFPFLLAFTLYVLNRLFRRWAQREYSE